MNTTEKELLGSNLIAQVKEANNFDFIRFFLAYSVMFNHFSTLTDTEPFWFVSGGFRVKGFFIISGFLVMFSFLRSPDAYVFFRKRVQRIMPAYSLAILLCLVLGFFLTALPHHEFLTSSKLYTYLFTNLLTLNFLCPDLPGVFENNPMQAMNGSLWTIKVELMLYMTVPAIYWLLKKYKKSVCLLLIYVLSFIYSTTCNYLADTTHNAVYDFLKRQFPGQMMYFCSGIILLAYFPLFRKYMKYIFPTSILLFIGRDLPGLALLTDRTGLHHPVGGLQLQMAPLLQPHGKLLVRHIPAAFPRHTDVRPFRIRPVQPGPDFGPDHRHLYRFRHIVVEIYRKALPLPAEKTNCLITQ